MGSMQHYQMPGAIIIFSTYTMYVSVRDQLLKTHENIQIKIFPKNSGQY